MRRISRLCRDHLSRIERYRMSLRLIFDLQAFRQLRYDFRYSKSRNIRFYHCFAFEIEVSQHERSCEKTNERLENRHCFFISNELVDLFFIFIGNF